MPNCQVADQLGEVFIRQAREDAAGLFGDDEDLLQNLDLSVDIDDVDLSLFETHCCEDSDDDQCNIRGNHDCMLGGQCCNKEFQETFPTLTRTVFLDPVTEPFLDPLPLPLPPQTPQPDPPSVLITHSANKVVTIQKCMPAGSDVVVVTNRTPVKSENRSLLLNRTAAPQPQPQPQPPVKVIVKREMLTPQCSRPDTPLSQAESESEEDLPLIPISTDNSARIFRSALDVLTTTSVSWTDDILFGSADRTKEEKPAGPSKTDLIRMSACAYSDHNYIGSNKGFRLDGLILDTPSDSGEDEEIDVVSVSQRSSSSRSSSCSDSGLSTTPTSEDSIRLEEISSSLILAGGKVAKRKMKKTKGKRKRRKVEPYEDDLEGVEDMDMEERGYQTAKRKRNAAAQRRKKNSRFGEEEDSQEKRDLHNNMERMRRIDLRNSFDELKALVPALVNKDRAAKVVILREAASYCSDLSAQCQSKSSQVMALRKEQERLRRAVSSLRKAACLSRRR